MKKTTKAISAAFLSALSAMSVITSCSKNDELTIQYFEENKTEVIENSISYEKIYGTTENPLEMFMTPSDRMTVSAEINREEAEIDLSVAADTENSAAKIDFGLKLSDSKNIDIGIYLDKSSLTLSSETLIGDEVLALNFENFDTMLEKFDNSVLAASFGLQPGDAKLFCDQYGINSEYFEGIKIAVDEYTLNRYWKTYEDLQSEILTIYEKYYGEVSEESIVIGENEIDVLTVELALNDELLNEIIAYYNENIYQINERQEILLSSFVPEPFKQDFLINYRKAHYEAQNQEELNRILESLHMSGTCKYYINKSTQLLEKADVNADLTIEEKSLGMSLTAYYADTMSFGGVITDDTGNIYDVGGEIFTESDDKSASWIIAIDGVDPETEASFLISNGLIYDKTKGTYELYLNNDIDDMTANIGASGKLEYTEDSLEFTVDSATEDGVSIPVGLTVKFENKADIKKPENAKDILLLTEDDAYVIFGRLYASLSEQMSAYSPTPDYGYDDSSSDEAYQPLSYDDYEEYKDYYTFEEFCEYVDLYNSILADSAE